MDSILAGISLVETAGDNSILMGNLLIVDIKLFLNDIAISREEL